jgi:hypothetical protein
LPKLGWRQHHRVDLPADARLRLMQRLHRFRESDLAHQKNVHVATRTFLPARHGPEHQRQSDASAQAGQGLLQHITEARGLAQDPGQLRKDGAMKIGAIVHLIADILPDKHARQCESRQFLVQRAGRGAGQAGDFTHVVTLFRMQQQQAKHLLAIVSEEEGGEHGCSRLGYD